MAARLQVRRGKASRWKELNPVLAWGEIAHEIDTNFLKIGDGVSDWNSLPYFEGKQGLQGIQGEKGEKGDQGDIGPRGLQGLQGIQGIQGERGQKGDTGEKGEKGDRGPQGLKGEKGDKGQKGDKGERGEKGDKGERGLPGPQGIKGETGEQGPIGPAGPQGEQGSDGIASVSYPLKYKDKQLSLEQSFFTELVNNATKGVSAQGSGGGNLAIRWNGEKVVSAARNLNFTGTAISNVVVDGKDVTLTINDTGGGGGGGSQNVFSTFAVAGQSNIVADTTTDTFTFFAGSNIVLTTNPTTDTLSIALANEITVLDVNTDRIDFNLTPAATTVPQGRMIWDTSLSTVVLGMDNNVAAAIGQALYKFVHNSSGSQINKGQVVYISGGHASTSLTIELANASSETTAATTIGVAAENIPHGSDGFIVTQGLLTGIRTNTTPGTGGEGSLIWLDTVAGGFTFDRPTQPDHGVMVGWVVKLAGVGAGSIFVKITNGQELYELHDVLIQSPVDKQLLQYDGVAGVWKNKSVSDVINALTNVDLTTNNQLKFTYANNTTETFNFGSLAFQNGSLGSNGQVLFNNAGSIGGDAGLTYDPVTDTLTIGVAGSGAIVMGNGEFISNSVDGVVRIGPNGTASTDFSMTVDGTSWGSGVTLGTRRNSDGSTTAGGFLCNTAWRMGNAIDFALGGSNWYTLSYQESAGQGVMTIGLLLGSQNAGSSGALVIVQNNMKGSANRVPTTDHADPTLYLYARDNTNANDFIRMNHNTTDGTIETGRGKLLLKAASNVRIEGSAGAFDLPAGDGTLNQVIATNGSGVSSWTTLGSLAFQSGTFSGSSSGTNTGDQNVFTTIAVAGQSNVVADSTSDTLTFVAGSGISLTTNATNDTITITNTGGGGGGGGVTEEFVIAMAIAL